MTIIKKDGNVYTISGPNKLAKNQVSWDIKKLIFHNFDWKEEKFAQKEIAKKRPKLGEEIKKPDFIEKIDPIQIDPIQEIKKDDEIKKEKLEEIKNDDIIQDFELPFIKYKVLMHCLPAVNKKYTDTLYGEKWSKTQYKEKFIFPSVLMSNTDLVMEFWSTDPNKKINENSIVFPFAYEIYNQDTSSYDRVPFDEHRWWSVSSREKKETGWLFRCVPSSNHPDFSD